MSFSLPISLSFFFFPFFLSLPSSLHFASFSLPSLIPSFFHSLPPSLPLSIPSFILFASFLSSMSHSFLPFFTFLSFAVRKQYLEIKEEIKNMKEEFEARVSVLFWNWSILVYDTLWWFVGVFPGLFCFCHDLLNKAPSNAFFSCYSTQMIWGKYTKIM